MGKGLRWLGEYLGRMSGWGRVGWWVRYCGLEREHGWMEWVDTVRKDWWPMGWGRDRTRDWRGLA